MAQSRPPHLIIPMAAQVVLELPRCFYACLGIPIIYSCSFPGIPIAPVEVFRPRSHPGYSYSSPGVRIGSSYSFEVTGAFL